MENWRKETKKVIENLAKSSRRRENDTCSRYLRYSAFREAIRNDAIDAREARRIFRKSYAKLADICEREGCSMNRARTINAFLEAAVDAALRRAKLPGILKTYDSVEALLEDLAS